MTVSPECCAVRMRRNIAPAIPFGNKPWLPTATFHAILQLAADAAARMRGDIAGHAEAVPRRSPAAATIAWATGCSEARSTAAAAATTSSQVTHSPAFCGMRAAALRIPLTCGLAVRERAGLVEGDGRCPPGDRAGRRF